MNCFVCGKKKKSFEVWTNKIVIGATYDSEFQDNEIVRSLPEKSVICHNCMKKIHEKVNEKRKTE